MTTAASAGGARAQLAARWAYVLVLALATLSPFRFDLSADLIQGLRRTIEVVLTPRDAVDAARNVLLFAGWGALWVVTARGGRGYSLVIRGAVLTGAVLSISVELLQLWLPSRRTSVLDVVTNTTGTAVGAWVVVAMIEGARRVRTAKSYIGVPAFPTAIAYLGAVTVESVFGLQRNVPLSDASGGPLARWSVSAAAFDIRSVFSASLSDVVLFVPLGVLLVVAAAELGTKHRRAALVTTLSALLYFPMLEICRGPLGLQMEAGPAVVRGVAVAAGAWLAARLVPQLSQRFRGKRRVRAVMAAYAIILALWAWRPFVPASPSEIASSLSWSRLIPLQAHAWRVELFSVADIISAFVLFLPLGFMLAVWPLTKGGWLRGCLPALYAALALEMGQVLVRGRYFDGTDVIVQGAGALIAWIAIRRAGFPEHGHLLGPG